ncbi:hypothetical protein H257_13339 [Aphanomyces astaci]|uniref:EF-hand domain-containing protein n=1 Tax=Aphanomyces astaci TaxID=112090 RepID=W4FXQ9_APHAT|nr:hypothetical protein H257_13339 [Aphanomyces astaci]ETV71463.1 hypothetical protein H257_13339 [Aphanomyces astaci]|eukprot:XP_009839128.1 hypothetical protein H257_13339 [Aphanomyces astaci]
MSSVARAPSYGSVTSSDLTSSAHEHAATKSTDVTSRTRPPLHQNRFSFTRSPVPSNHGQPTTDINANNPFVALTPWSEVSTYEVCKMVLMCIFLVPVLRVALCVLLFVPIVVLATISTAGHRPFNEHGAPVPLARWRRVVGVPIKWLIRCVLFVLGYYYIPVTKPAQTSQVKPRVIVANHSTYIDGIFLAAYTHGSVAMMKEVADLPLIGPVIRSLDPILIERRSELGRKKALDDIHEHMVNQAFPPLVIFPQGMTCSQQFITKFKKGAFAEGLPVQPVLLRYPYKHLDISWFPSVNVIPLFFRHLCQFRMYLEVTFLEPYVPTSEEAKNPDLYAENVRQAMAAALPAKCTNHSFEDVRLLLQAGVGEYARQHIINHTTVGEVYKLMHLSHDEIESLVRHFASIDTDHDGRISLTDLQTLFDECPLFVQRLFDLLDADQNGRIDFRELCIGLSSLNQPKKDDSPAEEYRDRLARFVFTLYDADNSGLLSRLELVAMLKQLRSTSGLYDDQTALDQLVAAFDEDLDGAFSVHEFIRLTEHHPELLDQVVERLAVFKSATGGKA